MELHKCLTVPTNSKESFSATIVCFNDILFCFSTQNILKKTEEKSERETNAIKAHQQLEQVNISPGLDLGWTPTAPRLGRVWTQAGLSSS